MKRPVKDNNDDLPTVLQTIVFTRIYSALLFFSPADSVPQLLLLLLTTVLQLSCFYPDSGMYKSVVLCPIYHFPEYYIQSACLPVSKCFVCLFFIAAAAVAFFINKLSGTWKRNPEPSS